MSTYPNQKFLPDFIVTHCYEQDKTAFYISVEWETHNTNPNETLPKFMAAFYESAIGEGWEEPDRLIPDFFSVLTDNGEGYRHSCILLTDYHLTNKIRKWLEAGQSELQSSAKPHRIEWLPTLEDIDRAVRECADSGLDNTRLLPESAA